MNNNAISVRMDRADIGLIRRICKSRREHISDFVRRAVRTELARLSYLTDKERKALGLETGRAGKDKEGGGEFANNPS